MLIFQQPLQNCRGCGILLSLGSGLNLAMILAGGILLADLVIVVGENRDCQPFVSWTHQSLAVLNSRKILAQTVDVLALWP